MEGAAGREPVEPGVCEGNYGGGDGVGVHEGDFFGDVVARRKEGVSEGDWGGFCWRRGGADARIRNMVRLLYRITNPNPLNSHGWDFREM